jgi:hypothetical protein
MCGRISNTGNNSDNELNRYIDIELKFSSDTVRYGENLQVTVLFKNKTDSSLMFYPKCIMALAKPFIAFISYTDGSPFHESYSLNYIRDYRLVAKIEPKSTYTFIFNIKVETPFFVSGENKIYFHYSCPALKEDNKLCGRLQSQDVALYVN